MNARQKAEFEVGALVELKSGGPAMVVRDHSKGELVCRWFSGDTLKEKRFFLEELRPFSSGGLVERLEKARARMAEKGQDEASERELARRMIFMVEQSKHGGPAVPDAIVKLVEEAMARSVKGTESAQRLAQPGGSDTKSAVSPRGRSPT